MQNRIMRTYEVTLKPFNDDDKPVTVEVNLSYELDGLQAIDLKGHVVEPNGFQAHLEAINRLRRLAATKRVDLSPELIDKSDWDVKMTRHTLVRVETDETGKPVRKAKS